MQITLLKISGFKSIPTSSRRSAESWTMSNHVIASKPDNNRIKVKVKKTKKDLLSYFWNRKLNVEGNYLLVVI